MDKCMQEGYKNSDFLGVYAHEQLGILKKEIYEEKEPLKFEGKQILCCAKYDEILTSLYGDYMTPPPEKERVPIHAGEIMYRK